MELADKVIVVTGGANGIGAAMCRKLKAEGARKVVVSDVDAVAAEKVASEIDGLAIHCNVADEAQVKHLVYATIETCGRIDVFCSNAGITVKGVLESSNDDWQRMWDVNVMSRLYAARAVVPKMLERGSGYLVHSVGRRGADRNRISVLFGDQAL